MFAVAEWLLLRPATGSIVCHNLSLPLFAAGLKFDLFIWQREICNAYYYVHANVQVHACLKIECCQWHAIRFII